MTNSVVSRAQGAYGVRLLADPKIRAVAVGLLLLVAFARLAQLFLSAGLAGIGPDFLAYFGAAQHVLDGQPIYDAAQLAGPYGDQLHGLYLYPPFLAVVVTPLAALVDEFRTAAWLWTAGGLAILVASIAVVMRVDGWRVASITTLIALAVALPSVGFELYIGNVHIILLGLLAAAWLAVERDDRAGDIVAGVAIGAAALIKLFPAVLIVWLVLVGRTRAAVFALVAIVVLAAATLPFVGIDDWLNYPLVLANLLPPTELTMAPTSWLAPVIGFTPARIIVTLIGLGIVVWSARSQPRRLSYAVTIVVSLLVVPALWVNYLALMVLPLLLFFSGGGLTLRALLAYVAVFGATQLVLWHEDSAIAEALGMSAVLLVLVLILTTRARPRCA